MISGVSALAIAPKESMANTSTPNTRIDVEQNISNFMTGTHAPSRASTLNFPTVGTAEWPFFRSLTQPRFYGIVLDVSYDRDIVATIADIPVEIFF